MSDGPDEETGIEQGLPPGSALEPTATNVTGPLRVSVGEVLAGRYLILEMLGMGAMGMVYRAQDQELDLEVALKVLRPELGSDGRLLERFRRELVLARQVTHKHVVRIHDIGKDDDLVFLTMDLVEGQSLRQILEERGALAPDQAADLAGQLARALAAAHEVGVIHRDLKPSNVMVDAEGNAYITDFGVARSVASGGLTRTGFIVGTPEFLSPEQVRGEELDGRADIYALGVLLYELLTAKLPTTGVTADETLAQQLQGIPSQLAGLPPEVPANLRAILKRCLSPDRQRRYQKADDLAADLETWSKPPLQLPPGRWFVRIGGAVAAMVILLVGVYLWNRSQEDRGTAAEPATAVVILPFADETQRPELAWLSTGISELLFESLIRQEDIRVVNPQRVAQVVADLKLEPGAFSEDTLELASGLFDSSRLLTGSVRSTPEDGLRIDARLVNPAAGLAAAVFLHVETPGGAGAATRVVRELESELLDSLAVKRSTDQLALDSAALPKYSQAVQLLWRGDAIGARVLLQEAVAEDESFGAGWLRLSQAYEAMGQYDQALEAADRAIASLGDSGSGSDRIVLLARAQQARLSGEPTRAQEVLQELVDTYPGDIESAVELADAYGSEGQFGQALELLGGITEKAPANPQAWFLRAKYSILSGQSRIAIDEFLVRAMVLQNKLKNRQGQADVLNAFGVAYRELGEVEEAEESYRRAADLRKEIGDERGYAASLHNLAQIAIFRGDFEAAEENLQAAMRTYESLADEAGIADFYNELGLMEEARSDYPAALKSYRSSLQIRRRLGDQRAIAESLNNIGFANHQIGNYEDASVYWQQALDLYVDTGNLEGQITVGISLGQLHTTRGEWADAQRTLVGALEGARELDWQAAMAAAEGSLGRVAQVQGRYAPALSYYEQALSRFAELEDERGTVEFSLAKAQAHLEIGAATGVLEVLDEIEKPLANVANNDQRAQVLALRGSALQLLGEPERGAASLTQAVQATTESANTALNLRIRLEHLKTADSLTKLEDLAREARSLGDKPLELEVELELSRALARAGRPKDAVAALERLERSIRRTGAWSQFYWVCDLRAELEGDSASTWSALRDEEFDRVTTGLSADLLQAFRKHTGRGEHANAA